MAATSGTSAEDELERIFQKASFCDMHICGQFNLGFILARLGRDLFIIDQHASDEKFNFERLTRTTQLNRQPLLAPQPLDLTPSEAITVRCAAASAAQNSSIWPAQTLPFMGSHISHKV